MIFDGVKFIFFDLDDTLCAYWDASKSALIRTFEELGPVSTAPSEMSKHWAASFREFAPTLKRTHWYEIYLQKAEPTRSELMRLTLLRVGIDDPAFARMLGDRYATLRDKALSLFDDAIPVLEQLKQYYGLGLMTNGPADMQRMEVATLGVAKYFDPILIEGEMGEGKPNASVFRLAEELSGFGASELAFVGNSYAHDIAPALEFGWRAVWVRRPSDVPPSHNGHNEAPEEIPSGGESPTAIIK